MAFTMGPIVFVVVVFGGLGSLTGCFIASLLMGLIQTFAVVVDYSLADLLAKFGLVVTAKTPFAEILTVTLPLCLPGIIAGAILAFAKSMGEFGATITFVSNIPGETQTLPALIYTLTQVPGGDAAAMRLTLVSIAISMLALLGSELLAKRIGARRQTA